MTNNSDTLDAAPASSSIKKSSLKQSGRYGRIVRSEEGGYRWMPYALTFEEVRAYYNENFVKEEIPYLNQDGDLRRMNLIFDQIPKQDIDAHFCSAIKPDRVVKHVEFAKMRNSKYFDVGIPRRNERFFSLKCRGCQKPIEINSFYIQSMITFNTRTEKTRSQETMLELLKDACWHPRCFKCARCTEHLVDLAHCVHKNKLFCMRHFDEKFRPRCAKCHEVSVVITQLTNSNELPTSLN